MCNTQYNIAEVRHLSEIDGIVSNLVLELRRGTIILCVLSQLKDKKYGYSLVETLDEKGMHIDPGTLYPLLRRLEKQNLLKSEWETSGQQTAKVLYHDGHRENGLSNAM